VSIKSKTKCLFRILFVISILLVQFHLAPCAADIDETVVYTPDELKSAMEKPEGSNVKLGANIKFPASLRRDDAIEIPGGNHTLNLNGYSIEYVYVNSAREYSGTPIRQNGNLTINGSGSILGGYVAIENSSRDSTLTINGGSYQGLAASGLRIQGITSINSGTFAGRFGDVWLEGGILADHCGAVNKIDYTFKKGGINIEKGVLTGSAELRGILVVDDLAIAEDASIVIKDRGALVVNGNLAGEQKIRLDGGMLIKNGTVTNQGYFYLTGNLKLNSLEIPSGVDIMVMENNTLEIDNLINNGSLQLRSGGMLIVNGSLLNNGFIHVDQTENLMVSGNISGEGNFFSNDGGFPDGKDNHGPTVDCGRMQRAADDLYALGLFKGTGTDSEGNPIYDLMEAPTRQVAITMLIRLLGKEADARSGDWDHPFTDVDSWAEPYVGYAYVNGLTKGVSEDKFGGNNLVSTYQYLTLTLRALGYDDSAGDFRWDDPNALSEKIELTSGDYQDNSAPFYRGDIAIISHLALQRQVRGGTSLIECLVDLDAVRMEDVIKIGFDHLLQNHGGQLGVKPQ